MVFIKNKKANILVENIIFIILNLIFLAILILFVVKQGSGAVVVEQSYAKQIALLIDSAKPGMLIKLNMEDAKELAEDNKFDFDKIVDITDNKVTVRVSEKGGYSYGFFNNVDVSVYPDANNDENYVVRIDNYN